MSFNSRHYSIGTKKLRNVLGLLRVVVDDKIGYLSLELRCMFFPFLFLYVCQWHISALVSSGRQVLLTHRFTTAYGWIIQSIASFDGPLGLVNVLRFTKS